MDICKELSLFEEILGGLSRWTTGESRVFGTRHHVALRSLGFRPEPSVLEFLGALRLGRVAPLHLSVARRLARNGPVLRTLSGFLVDERLLELLGFERAGALFSRSFINDFQQRPEKEESVWWAVMHLERAVHVYALTVPRIDSVTRAIGIGAWARTLLLREGIPLLAD